ncbi:hypothetical protein Vpro01_01909 [Vibrio proteolyticus]
MKLPSIQVLDAVNHHGNVFFQIFSYYFLIEKGNLYTSVLYFSHLHEFLGQT